MVVKQIDKSWSEPDNQCQSETEWPADIEQINENRLMCNDATNRFVTKTNRFVVEWNFYLRYYTYLSSVYKLNVFIYKAGL